MAKALTMDVKPADRERIGEKTIEQKNFSLALQARQKADNRTKIEVLEKKIQNEVDLKSA